MRASTLRNRVSIWAINLLFSVTLFCQQQPSSPDTSTATDHQPKVKNVATGPAAKETKLTERQTIQLRAEFFNLFNHTQFVNPDGNISDGATFGTVVRARDPRLIQFALKLVF